MPEPDKMEKKFSKPPSAEKPTPGFPPDPLLQIAVVAPPVYLTDLCLIATAAAEKEVENDRFLDFIRQQNATEIDKLVHAINETVSAGIDCTRCGNCCRSLIINVTGQELSQLADHLNLTEETTREKYIEESQSGNYFINTIPCHFFADNKCSIYDQRFTECRDFPHLHKPGFTSRLPGTMLHYGGCPIVHNVIEEVKTQTGFHELAGADE